MNQFLEACGATSPLQITVDAPGAATREVHSFDLPFVIVGRVPGSDLQLDHPEVSERHAYIQLIDGRLVFLDLGSRIGIQQGGKRRRLGLLQREPATRIGPYRLRWISADTEPSQESGSSGFDLDESDTFELAERSLAKTVEAVGETSAGDCLVLDLSHRSTRRTRVEVRGGIALVGSGADCNVRLIDPSVSSFHGSLVQTQAGTWLVDLLGKGGIRVNGRLVNHARLFEGDEAQIGASAFRVEALPAPAREAGRLGFARSARRNHASPVEPAATDPIPVPESEPLAAAKLIADPKATRPETDAAASNPAPAGPRPKPRSTLATLLALTELQENPATIGSALSLSEKPQESPNEANGELATTGLSVMQTAEIVERVVSPLLDQLTEMRRQMVDEFHQARVMMFETIGSLQQEHSAVFNEEIEQLRRLAKELETHRRELGQQAEKLSESASSLDRYPATLVPEPASSKSLHFQIVEAEPEMSIVPVPRAVNGGLESYRSVSKPHDEQIHAVLCDRITRLKEDHQTRWQKLLGIFPSAATGKPS